MKLRPSRLTRARAHAAHPRRGAVAVALAVAALAGCSLTSPIPDARLDLPAAFTASAAAAPIDRDWWRRFDTPELADLIAAAFAHSPDAAMAMERVRQAEAAATSAGASLFPSLGLSASSSRRRSDASGTSAVTSDSSSASLSASYELDLWGANRAAARAGDANLRASHYDEENTRLTLAAGVATGYFQTLSLRARIATARENLTIAERVYRVVDARARNGAASALDLSQQQTSLLSQRASLVSLELQERQTLHALAILVGRAPQGFALGGASLAGVAVPEIGAGLPADLLARRPDLASAEEALVAANANLAAARAALLPTVSLSASGGVSSAELFSLAAATNSLSIGAALVQTIFDGGRLRAQVDSAAARERELVESYRKAVLAALADVEDALVAAQRNAEQEDLQRQVRDEARRTLRLSELRYREGSVDLLTVLDAQRTLFSAEDSLEQLKLARLNAAVSLYKALGGGWQRPDTPA